MASAPSSQLDVGKTKMSIEQIKAAVDSSGIYRESMISLMNGYLHGIRDFDDIKRLSETNGMSVFKEIYQNPKYPKKTDYLLTFRPGTTNH